MITTTNQVGSREAEIPRELETLLKNQEVLREKIVALESRLSLVLRNAPPVADGKKEAEPCRQTELGAKLDAVNLRAAGSIKIIGDILDRLEL
jgi:hypothetical protein